MFLIGARAVATAAFDLDSVRFRCESLILTVYATVDTQSQVCQDTPVPLALAPPHRPPRAARMDLRDACCSRNPPDPQRSRHAMRPRSPSADAPQPHTTSPSRSQVSAAYEERRAADARAIEAAALARAEAERAAASELNAAARALSDFAVDCAASCLWVAWLRLGWP